MKSTPSVAPAPDYFRIGWTPSTSTQTLISVRDNDEVTLRRCATVGGMEQCIDVTAVCGAVFADMKDLFELLDGLSARIKTSWDSQLVQSGDPAGTKHGEPPLYRLPGYGNWSDIGLAEILQASWPLLPLRYMFLNWDMGFKGGVDLQHAGTFASNLKTELNGAYSAITRDHKSGTWTVRKESHAAAQLSPATLPTSLVDWLTDRGGAGLPFPAYTLGALLDGTKLAVKVDGTAVPDKSDAFGTRLHDLTGDQSFNSWGSGLQTKSAADLENAIGGRLTPEQRELLQSGTDPDLNRVTTSLKVDLPGTLGLYAKTSADAHSDAVPYTVRSVLAYLKILAEDSANQGLGGFQNSQAYQAHQFPFHVLFEAPDLTAGLLELYGLPRPAYRSVSDITFSGSTSGVFFEQRAESLLLEMFDYCADELVISDADRFLRWDDPFADTASDPYASVQLAEASPLTGSSGFQIDRAPDPAGDADGSVIRLTGTALGEATLWYCYSFELAGCAEPWTPVTVLVEPAGWDDARIVIQRDHFHVVVDWNSGSVHVLRPSPDATGGIADISHELGGDYGVEKVDGSGKWVNDPAARKFMPPGPDGPKWGYEVVGHYCCLTNSSSAWSFEVQLPVIDNDEVHFYDKPDPARPAGPGNELVLLEGTATCDTSRYCRHVQAHELPNRQKLAGPKIDIAARTAPNGITATISSRSTAGGATVPLFDNNKKYFFEKFWLSYCVSAPNVGCATFTDRRQNNLSSTDTVLNHDHKRQGHCVMATSLDLPVAPNAPSLLTLREWARQTGRPQGSFYFRRNIAAPGFAKQELLGWDSDEVTHHNQALRNYECPALDPQNPRLAADWSKVDNDRRCTANAKHYSDAATREYKAYRRFWRCYNSEAPAVSEFKAAGPRAGHPTEFNVFVTLEFVNDETTVGPKTPKETLEGDKSEQIGSAIHKCAISNPTTAWDGDDWDFDPATDAKRGQPRDDWCVPPSPGSSLDLNPKEPCNSPASADPPPGYGVLLSGHYRWNQIQSSKSSTSNEPLSLFPVSAGLQVNTAVGVCQNADMSIAGVWPTFPNDNSGTNLPHPPYWPLGACDGVNDNPAYEIDTTCEKSYPLLFDCQSGQLDAAQLLRACGVSKPDGPESGTGIQLHADWQDRICLLAGLRDGCAGSPPPDDPKAPDPDTFGGCVGEAECKRWVIPEPGFYHVRLLVEPKPGASFPTFVFDKIIWAQALYSG